MSNVVSCGGALVGAHGLGHAARIKFEVTLLVALGCTAGLIGLYHALPVGTAQGAAIWWRLLLAGLLFSAALGIEMRAVVRHDEPMRRAVVSLSVLVPLFVVLFAWMYLTMSTSDPASFGHPLTRTEALYLTMTVLSTVGFGDITPKTDPGRVLTMIQMVADVVLLAVGVKLIFHFGSRAAAARREPATSDRIEVD
jgi:hypothetical protein